MDLLAANTKIEWTESTWNPVTGCSKISSGCKNCYACTLAKRLKAMGNSRYVNGFNITLHEDLINTPLTWKKPKHIFVNSMSDLFHEDIPLDFIKRVFETMNKAHWHTFQILTKRSERLLEVADKLAWTSNIWQGVTVESQQYVYRIEHLKHIPSTIKFISFEPLLSSIHDISFDGINWVIVGGESGYGARPMEEKWVLDIKNICEQYNTPFFFKQWGGFNKKRAGRLLQGRTWDEYPNVDSIVIV